MPTINQLIKKVELNKLLETKFQPWRQPLKRGVCVKVYTTT